MSSSAKTTSSKTAPSKKEKRSGSGMAFLALLCSLGALGLSGYNYYLQNLSPQSKQSQDSLLIGVNEIKSNVTEFGTVITGLQKDVQDFKASQAQYITKDTLSTAVKQGVDIAVQNLPELPNIGPKSLELDSKGQNESAADGQTTGSQEKDGQVEVQDSSVDNTKQANQTTADGAAITSSSESVDTGQASTEQAEDDSFWSWGRAKKDIKGMLNSFIKIEKTDQN